MDVSKRVLVIGVGQMGGSIALGLVQASGYDVQVFDKDPAATTFWQNKLADDPTSPTPVTDLITAAKEADHVILATPISTFGSIVSTIAPHLKSGAIISDIGSAKVKSIERIEAAIKESGRTDIHYVPAHPGVGNDGKGPETAKVDMLKGKSIFLVPQDGMNTKAFEQQKKLYADLGAGTPEIDAASHDNFFGTTSHLEHAIVFALTSLGRDAGGGLNTDYKNGGSWLLNTTRIAKGANKDMWLAIFDDNREAILESAKRFKGYLQGLTDKVVADDRDALHAQLLNAHEYRKTMQNDVARETVFGELQDAFGGKGGSLQQQGLKGVFAHEAFGDFARRTGLPALIGVAIALNVKETDETLVQGLSIAEKANPSVLDGTAPALANPDTLTGLLVKTQKHAGLDREVARFISKFDEVIEAIAADNKPYLAKLIDEVHQTRLEMPDPRRDKTVRPQYA